MGLRNGLSLKIMHVQPQRGMIMQPGASPLEKAAETSKKPCKGVLTSHDAALPIMSPLQGSRAAEPCFSRDVVPAWPYIAPSGLLLDSTSRISITDDFN